MVPSSALRPSEAARALGISERYLLKLAHAGRIKCQVTPLGRLYDPRDVETLRASREAAA